MLIDLSRWNAVEIGAGATCLAALVAAVASFVVAAVNGRSARILSRETAAREFRLSGVRLYLEFVDQRIALYRELAELGPRFNAAVERVSSPQLPEERAKAYEALKPIHSRLDEILAEINIRRPFYSQPLLVTFAFSDRRMLDYAKEWSEEERLLLEVSTALGVVSGATDNLKKLEECASDAFVAAVRSRMALEDFVFGNRGWLRRGAYWARSMARDTWKKVTSRLARSEHTTKP